MFDDSRNKSLYICLIPCRGRKINPQPHSEGIYDRPVIADEYESCSAQASEIKDIKDWRDPLAAIVMYTFDLGPPHKADENFYYRLNKVGSRRNLRRNICAEQWSSFTVCKQGTWHFAVYT
jgi:hypothetical protein